MLSMEDAQRTCLVRYLMYDMADSKGKIIDGMVLFRG